MRCPHPTHRRGRGARGSEAGEFKKKTCGKSQHFEKEMISERKLKHLASGVCKFIIYIANIFIKTSQGNKAN